ncbi:T9SS type A sorting domain-containing protein [Cryomorpha ignava]|uniref:T9SS type A sorting domain-containing protein n=1 Tax=Cryomorpha ignava TaxID=101383 RepID=A0A7K3WVA0_9FLAO|nr:T9SS type A sorting domain-containing protein [Cryomorpha ignava]NEN25414.1 T9SS type A sorting domain-containing protein [Cryomorpha ignava]
MKSLFQILFLFLSVNAFAQPINQFTISDSRWYVARTYPNANMENPSFVETRTTIFGFIGDTLIENESWFKMYSATDEAFQENLLFEGYIHSTDSVVMYRNPENVLDTLYDFRLSVGDSVLFDFGFVSEKIPVINIDNVEILGEEVMRIHFAETAEIFGFVYFKEKWIYGVGSVHGPLAPARPGLYSDEIPDSLYLTCSFSNSELYWDNPFYTDCLVNYILGIDDSEIAEISVYPNPYIDKVTFESDFSSPVQLEIYDMQGKKLAVKMLDNFTNTMDVSRLKPGIYFFIFSSEKGVFTKKMVKL